MDLSASRVVALPPEEAFDRTLAIDLAVMYAKGAGPIPGIRATRDLQGSWSAVGDRRQIDLADGNSTVETLTSLDRPTGWTYALSDITGPLNLLVGAVEGRFSFAPSGAGTDVTWSWSITPRSVLVAPLLQVIGFFWRRYAAGGLAELERQVAAGP